jgi:peptidoglycan/LPS O-acetylase OafA/YrhL
LSAAVADPVRARQAPPALRPPPRNPRFPALDGVRGTSAIFILLYHVGVGSQYNVRGALGQLTARLNVGLALFFALSGFLLYRPYVRARLKGSKPPSAVRFWERRALRIVPGYWAALALMITIPGLVTLNSGLEQVRSSEFPIFFGFAQVYHASTAGTGGLGQAWTLCVEASFYLLLPAFAALSARIADSATEAILIVGLGALSVFERSQAHAHGNFGIPVTIAGNFAWLGAGMLLALWSAELQARNYRRRIPVLPCWLAAAGIYVLISVALPRSPTGPYTTDSYLAEHLGYLAVAVFILLPLCMGEPSGRLARVAASRPARWLGLISYGVYLWHIVPIAFAVRHWYPQTAGHEHFLGLMAFALPSALVLGTASYLLIERSALRRKP